MQPLPAQFLTARHRAPAFTLIELLVVIAIIAILTAVTVPAIRTLSKSNDQSQGANMVRAMITSARSVAIAEHRMAGVVFFEETSQYSLPVHGSQTAMQLIVEDYNQSQYNAPSGLTVFSYFSTARQYLPEGIRIAMLSDTQGSGGTGLSAVEQSNTSQQARVILFDANGQLLLRNGLGTFDPGVGGANQGTYPTAFGDWKFLTPSGVRPGGGSGDAYSSPGFFLYSRNEMDSQNFGTNDGARAAWVRKNSTVVLVNANTGGVSR